ncbi:MAG: NAD-dependent epimerase/dehydratase family protein [Planctomycetaceae bacterium]
MERIAITGSSGYIGTRLTEAFQQRGCRVLGIDVRPSTAATVPDEFIQADIRDGSLHDAIGQFRPDTIIHSAFVVKPIRDVTDMADINRRGTENILSIVEQLQPRRFLFLSSATAYGAWPDNPVPMSETWPLRARSEYQYAADKTELDKSVAEFAVRNPDVCVSWVRPAIVGGPGMDNYLYRFIFTMPMLARLDGFDNPLQFVHEDDVISAMLKILEAGGRGAYNLGPPNWTLTSEIASLSGRRTISMPFRLAWLGSWLAWKIRFRLHESPPGLLYFARYPWTVNPNRLQNELGFQFQFTSTQTVHQIIARPKTVRPPASRS